MYGHPLKGTVWGNEIWFKCQSIRIYFCTSVLKFLQCAQQTCMDGDLFKKIASLALVVGSEWLSAVPVRCSWQDSSNYVTEISCKVCRRIQQSVKQLQECCAPHLISEKEIKTKPMQCCESICVWEQRLVSSYEPDSHCEFQLCVFHSV